MKTFAGKAISTEDWRAHLENFFSSSDAQKKLATVDFDGWLNGEGTKLPVELKFDTTLVDQVHLPFLPPPKQLTADFFPLPPLQAYALADRWATAKTDADFAAFNRSDLASFETDQTVVFLEKLQTVEGGLSVRAVAMLDEIYGLSTAGNAELAWRFFAIALKSGKEYAEKAAVWVQDKGSFVLLSFKALQDGPDMISFLYFRTHEGASHPSSSRSLAQVAYINSSLTLQFCRSTYKSIFKVNQELARKTFQDHAAFYHPIARRMIAQVRFFRLILFILCCLTLPYVGPWPGQQGLSKSRGGTRTGSGIG